MKLKVNSRKTFKCIKAVSFLDSSSRTGYDNKAYYPAPGKQNPQLSRSNTNILSQMRWSMHRISAWWLWTVKYLWKLRWVFSRLNHDSHFTIRFWEHIWNSLHGEVKFKADVQVRTDSPICLIAIHYVNHNSKVQQNNIMKKVSRSKTKHVTNCLLCLMFLKVKQVL